MNKERKVVLRFSHTGDVVLITGILTYRYTHYHEEFIVITKKGMGCFFQNHPAVIECIELDVNDLKLKNFIHVGKNLAKNYPYPLYDLHNNTRSKILKFLWEKATYTYNKLGLERRLFLLSKGKIKSLALDSHVTQRYYSAFSKEKLSPQELLPEIYLSEDEIAEMKKRLECSISIPFLEKDTPCLIAIHSFATHKTKEWPEENWQLLYEDLQKANYIPVFIGKGTVFPWIKPEHNFMNTLSFRESCALLKLSSCLITGDSGPMHMANGVQCPCLALFGSTVKEWGFFPQYGKSIVLENSLPCRPCSLHGKNNNCQNMHLCMKNIQGKMVLNVLNSHFLGLC